MAEALCEREGVERRACRHLVGFGQVPEARLGLLGRQPRRRSLVRVEALGRRVVRLHAQ